MHRVSDRIKGPWFLSFFIFIAALFAGFLAARATGVTFLPGQKLDNEFLACMALPKELVKIQCVGAHAVNWIDRYGVKTVSIELDKYENRFGADMVCHLAGHQIGKASYTISGNLFQALAQCTNGCFSACLHGAVIGFAEQGTVEQLLAIHPEKYCASPEISGNGGYRLCVHGLGHALMIEEHYDLAAALDDCNTLELPSTLHAECYSGVYMELEDAAAGLGEGEVSPSVYEKKGDLFYPCDVPPTSTREVYERQCFLQKAGALVYEARARNQSIFDICAMAPQGWEDDCVRGVGFVYEARDANFANVRGICAQAPTDALQNSCLFGAYGYLLAGQNSKDIQRFCAELPSNKKFICSRS